jgi:hypothetical protein
VAGVLASMSWTADVTGTLTVQVLVQFVNLYQQLQEVQLSPLTADRLKLRWMANGSYSSRSAYAALLLGQATVLEAKELWKARAPNKCSFFVWLVLLNRC